MYFSLMILPCLLKYDDNVDVVVVFVDDGDYFFINIFKYRLVAVYGYKHQKELVVDTRNNLIKVLYYYHHLFLLPIESRWRLVTREAAAAVGNSFRRC